VGAIDAAHDWRAQATNLRAAATSRHFDTRKRDTLLREAQAGGRQANWWADCPAQEFTS